MSMRSFSKPMGISHKWCSFCKYCIRTYQNNTWICAANAKTYYSDKIDLETNEFNISCMNGLWEFDEEKFKGRRW